MSDKILINVWLSCGHQSSECEGEFSDGWGYSCRTVDYDREGGRSVSYGSKCEDCYQYYKKLNLLLSRSEAELWMDKGELPANYPKD